MKQKLLGIGGYPEAGKDAVADYLVESFGWVKVNMSTPLLADLKTMNPIVAYRREHWYSKSVIPVRFAELTDQVGYVRAKENPEYRRLMKTYGTNVQRARDEDIWVNIAQARIKELHLQHKQVVITGMRFPNELRVIRQLGGTLLWVDRPSLDISKHQHASDVSVHKEDFDGVVVNDSTLARLYINSVNFLLDNYKPSKKQSSKS